MAKDMGYVKNVVKEVKQTARRASNSLSKSDREGYEKKYGRKIDIKIGNSKVKEQVGQLAGAVLQGRRYDEKGKQITAKKSAAASMAKKTAAPKKAAQSPSGKVGTRTEKMKDMNMKKVRTIKGGTGRAGLPKATRPATAMGRKTV